MNEIPNWTLALNRLFGLVEKQGGHPVVAQHTPDLDARATLLPATAADPVHRILYQEKGGETTSYLVAMEAAQLLRILQVPREQRQVLHWRREARERVVSATERRNRDLGLAQQRQLGLNLYDTTLSQLRTVPPALAVDRWLLEQLPELRGRQASFLRQQCQELAEGLVLGLDQRIPPLVLQANRAMDAAYAIHAAELIGLPELSAPFRGSPWEVLAKELLDLTVPSAPENAARSDPDRQRIDAWAEKLGIGPWYQWVPADPRGDEDP